MQSDDVGVLMATVKEVNYSRNRNLRISTRNLPGGVKGGRRVRLTSVCRLTTENMDTSTSHNPRAFTACYRDSFFFFYFYIYMYTNCADKKVCPAVSMQL
jgi:hypothetical protein